MLVANGHFERNKYVKVQLDTQSIMKVNVKLKSFRMQHEKVASENDIQVKVKQQPVSFLQGNSFAINSLVDC